jgi:hypothetical protein
MLDENGQNRCEIQIISVSGGEYSWAFDGYLRDVSAWQAATLAAGAAGVPLAVSFENGKISIWLDDREVAAGLTPLNAAGAPLFPGGAKVAVGLECWETAGVYSDISMRESR